MRVTIAIHVLMCAVVCSLYMPVTNSQRLLPFIRYLRTGGRSYPSMQMECGMPLQSCIPDVTPCCYGMKCLNIASHYCLYPKEKCVCITPQIHNVDTA